MEILNGRIQNSPKTSESSEFSEFFRIFRNSVEFCKFICICHFFVVSLQRNLKLILMNAVVYNTVEEKRSARQRLIVIKEAVEQQMRQRMTKMEW